MRNWRELAQTPRSIHFGREHGGLGMRDTHQGLSLDMKLHKQVYLYSALRRFSEPVPVRGHPYMWVRIPFLLSDALQIRASAEVETNCSRVQRCQALGALTPKGMDLMNEDFCDLTHKQLNVFVQSLNQRGLGFKPYQSLFNKIVKEGSYALEHAPELNRWLKNERFIAVDKKVADLIQNRILGCTIELLEQMWIDSTLRDSPFLCETPEILDLPGIDHLLEECQHFSLDNVLLFEEPILDDDFSKSCFKLDASFWDAVERSWRVNTPDQGVDQRRLDLKGLEPLFSDELKTSEETSSSQEFEAPSDPGPKQAMGESREC